VLFKRILFKIYKKYRIYFNTNNGIGIGKIYPINKIIKKCKLVLKPDFCYVQGHKIFLDKTDSLDLSINGIYGVLETNIIKNEINDGDVVIDLGANIGYYTLLLAKQVGPNGKVFAFEPESSNFQLLQQNIHENNYENVVSERKVVSDSNNSVNLWVGQKSSGANRIYEPKKSGNQEFKTTKVDSIQLDEYFSNSPYANKINFIKMDIEGAEFKALQGMKSILKKNQNLTILTEFAVTSLEDAGCNPDEFLKFFLDEKFEIFVIDESSMDLVPINKIDISKIKSDNETINLLCKKRT